MLQGASRANLLTESYSLMLTSVFAQRLALGIKSGARKTKIEPLAALLSEMTFQGESRNQSPTTKTMAMSQRLLIFSSLHNMWRSASMKLTSLSQKVVERLEHSLPTLGTLTDLVSLMQSTIVPSIWCQSMLQSIWLIAVHLWRLSLNYTTCSELLFIKSVR